MKEAILGGFIIYFAFGVFATAINRAFRVASGCKGTLTNDALLGFGLITLIGGLVAAVVYGGSLIGKPT